MLTPKQRMLNAYRGLPSDRYPVAPEFWYYYPAKVLGVSLVEFEREVPFWQALQTTFKKYATEGWGIAAPVIDKPRVTRTARFEKVGEDCYREIQITRFRGREFTSARRYSINEPSWIEKYMADDTQDLTTCLEMALMPEQHIDFSEANSAYAGVSEDYLLEFYLGLPFFDFVAAMFGFEKTVLYFLSESEDTLENYRVRYIENQLDLIRKAVNATPFESFFIGCSFSCNSLLGPVLWRRWDKPYIQAMTNELHRHGKLLHLHFHGRSMKTVMDFAELGVDCVCPFERPPGGDVDGLAGLQKVRHLLEDRVTMNGNVHTVETLIRGCAADVRREVHEIKEAFRGSTRLIIGTGDQVGQETPEENIWAMVEESHRDPHQ